MVMSRPDYVRTLKNGRPIKEHTKIVEEVLGKKLPPEAVVHHIDGNPRNNVNSNLIVLPNQAYHLELHQRERAYDACGNPDWRKCKTCKEYDDPINMKKTTVKKTGISSYYHKIRLGKCVK